MCENIPALAGGCDWSDFVGTNQSQTPAQSDEVPQ